MGLALGVGALFFGAVMVLVGFKGGGSTAMNAHLLTMLKGQYPDWSSSTVGNFTTNTSGTASTGGTYAVPQPQSPGTNP